MNKSERWLKAISFLVVFVLLGSCVSSSPPSIVTSPAKPSEKTEVTGEDLLLVDQLILARKFSEAISKIQELQLIDPSNQELQEKYRQASAELQFSDAQNLIALGQYGEAIKKIKSALDLVPNDQRMLLALDEAYLQLGMQYLDFMDPERAKEALNYVQYDQNMKIQAQGLLTTYLPAVEYTKQGYDALSQGNYTMAQGYFKAALQLKPDLEKAQTGLRAAEAIASQPPISSFPSGPTGSQVYPTQAPAPSEAATTPTKEVSSSWEKPEAPSGVQDWSNFKNWMENEINRWMSGSSINENPILDYQNLSLNEDPQAYNYLSESDFASSLYLSAIKIYGERALYIASEIPRLFPLPLITDPGYSTARERIGRLDRDVQFVSEGLEGLKAPTVFKETHTKLLDLINEEKRVLDSLWYGTAFPPSGVGDLSAMSQAYVDSFDKAQAKNPFVPFSELPKWAQLKKYYMEAGLYAYMLSEIAQDFEDILPLPVITGEDVPVYSPAVSLGGISVQLKSSNSSPQPTGTLTVSLIAYNSSTVTKFATVRASLPPQVVLIDQGAGTYREENGNRYIVWEGLALKPVNAGEEKTTTIKDFLVQISPNSLGQTLVFNVWLASQEQWLYFTPFAYSGNLSLQLSADNSKISSVDFFCQVVNSGTDALNFDLLIPIPQNSQLIGTTDPLASITTYNSQPALQWENQEIPANSTLTYKFTVNVNPGVSQVVLQNFAQLTVRPTGSLITTTALEVPIYRDPWQAVESSSSQLSLVVGPSGAWGSRSTFDELIRLVRYSETLHFDLATTQTPSDINQVAHQNFLKAVNELGSCLYWIPVKWAQLSKLPPDYLAAYPSYSPEIQGLFDPVSKTLVYPQGDEKTKLWGKGSNSFLSLSTDLTFYFGSPEEWKDMIEYLRAQLLERLAELGYR